MRFPMSACKLGHNMETQVNGFLLGEHPFDEEIILNKNKNMHGDSIDDKVTITGGSERETRYSGKPSEICPVAVPQVEARA